MLAELARPNVRGWYRNPPRAAVDSLGIAYRDDDGNWRSMHPDFVFFNEVGGKIVAVDRRPARPPPRGLADEAEGAWRGSRERTARRSIASRRWPRSTAE